MTPTIELSPVVFEVVRNRFVAVTEEMRIALQSVSGSPTVTEASDFFTGIFLPDGAVVSMGFQVALQAPVSGTVIRHINSRSNIVVRDGDMFVGNDPFIGALHQNDVQMVAPIFAGNSILAWAGVQAHQTDVGGMDFASWCPKAKDVYQEGIRIPCVKLVDRGELREDVLEMITTASRLPAQLGLDIRAFLATINVARQRISDLVQRYGDETVSLVMRKMIASSEAKIRARLRELPDGEFHACDFLEHDGHQNRLYKVAVCLRKKGDGISLDFSGSSRQALVSPAGWRVRCCRHWPSTFNGIRARFCPWTSSPRTASCARRNFRRQWGPLRSRPSGSWRILSRSHSTSCSRLPQSIGIALRELTMERWRPSIWAASTSTASLSVCT
jgi:N-methylhydantoinase B